MVCWQKDTVSLMEASRKEKRNLYFFKGLKLKTVSAFKKKFLICLKSVYSTTPLAFLKVARTKKEYLKNIIR